MGSFVYCNFVKAMKIEHFGFLFFFDALDSQTVFLLGENG